MPCKYVILLFCSRASSAGCLDMVFLIAHGKSIVSNMISLFLFILKENCRMSVILDETVDKKEMLYKFLNLLKIHF